jgi:hypothetical protein
MAEQANRTGAGKCWGVHFVDRRDIADVSTVYGLAARQIEKGRTSFFEKKKQKTFICSPQFGAFPWSLGAAQNRQKFFDSFLQERTFFLPRPSSNYRLANCKKAFFTAAVIRFYHSPAGRPA